EHELVHNVILQEEVHKKTPDPEDLALYVRAIVFYLATTTFSTFTSCFTGALVCSPSSPLIAARVGAITNATIDMSLIRMFIEGPEVSLKGSPTVSPVTEALCGSDFL